MKLPLKFLQNKVKFLQRILPTYNERNCSYTAVQTLCEKFSKEELAPVAATLDREERYPAEQIKKLAQMGLMGMTAPAMYGGSSMSVSAVSQAVEELSKGCASTGAIVSIHNLLYIDFLVNHGTNVQKEKFLMPYTKGVPGAFALSESEAGSDVANICTTATKESDCFILNGTKTWVTSGVEAEIAIVFATVDRSVSHRGITAFLVPLNMKGVHRDAPDEKLGIRATSTCQISLEDVIIPIENVVGEIGGGFKLAMNQLNKARIGIASQALGIAQSALDLALCYSMERQAFNKRLRDFQAVQIRLARMSCKIEAARLLVRNSADLCDKGEHFIKESATAKLMASEAATFASHQCIQILGGMGYVRSMPAERYYRDARITEIYGGVSDIQMLIIAEQLFKNFELKN